MEELQGEKELYEEYLCAAVEIAKKAGEEIRATFQGKKSIELKSSPADLVTETDQKVEQLIISFLRSKFPDHCFIGEETTAAGAHFELTDSPTWIIDPVDGTTNFVHSFQFVAVSIGLSIAKENIIGVIYNPVLDELFTAIKGRGAFCNGKPISCSRQQDISQCLALVEIGSSRVSAHLQTKLQNINSLIQQGVHGIRSLGSAALNICQVARGGGDVYIEHGIHCWDMAAGVVIIREAGGVIIDPRGGPLDLMSRCVLAASSSQLAASVSACTTHVDYPRD
ncbi:inositol monophosphatase 1-like [Acanthaster planci]|uniref:Inositol-1-monophosphatase n=1 Tax=Acanthaster planci TaxID=133434 RepID=A0A8B7ZT47_ACAPL|nr:inositol monophosphatase 1-like [Acanthaster planci]